MLSYFRDTHTHTHTHTLFTALICMSHITRNIKLFSNTFFGQPYFFFGDVTICGLAYFSTSMFFFLLGYKSYLHFNDIEYRLFDIYCKYFSHVAIVVALVTVVSYGSFYIFM